ncbi:MAG: glycosyltransferase family 4 protein [Thermodesulfobacteriota bacterium]
MRVLHINERLSARGGADRHLVAVLGHLQGRAETLLAVGHDDLSLPPAERAGLGPWRVVKGLMRAGLAPAGGGAARRRLAEAVAAFAPDLIHVHNLMDPELLALAAASAPALMTVQDHRAFCPGLGKLTPEGGLCRQPLGAHCARCFRDPGYGRRMIDLTRRRLEALAGFRRLLVLSRYMAEELAAAGVAPARVTLLPPMAHGLTPRAARGPARHHLLAGRLVERKGVRVALQAAMLLAAPLPLVVAGDGPLAAEVERAAAMSGGRVVFAGWADRQRMQALLAGAASLWLPSLWAEPFGISGLEAMALGTPVATSAVGGVGDWLEHGRNGLLVPPGDALALARAADRLAGAQGAAMGAAGAALAAQRFSAQTLTARLLDCYREVAAA